MLQFADEGDDTLVLITTLANGAAEEVFFRGAVYAALGTTNPAARTAAVYVLATMPTRNPALVLAAGVMGALWSAAAPGDAAALQAPMLTHLTWSTLMLKFLPPVFREASPAGKDVRAV